MQRLLVAVLLAVLATSVSAVSCSKDQTDTGLHGENLSAGQWPGNTNGCDSHEGVCLMSPAGNTHTVCFKNALGPIAKFIAKLPAAEKAKFDEAYKNAKGFPKVCACRDLVVRRRPARGSSPDLAPPAPPCAALPEAALLRASFLLNPCPTAPTRRM